MLKVMDERVLKCHVKERREMRRPHHKGEQNPGNERMGDHPNGATLQQRKKACAPTRGSESQQQRHWCRAEEEDRDWEEEKQVLHHVRAEERGVVAFNT